MDSERNRRGGRHRSPTPVRNAPSPSVTTTAAGCRAGRRVADLPTYGYRRIYALLRREAEKTERNAPNLERVYRVMKVHGLLLQRDGERHEERRHDGRVAVDISNTRWCSDGLGITCDNGVKVRVTIGRYGRRGSQLVSVYQRDASHSCASTARTSRSCPRYKYHPLGSSGSHLVRPFKTSTPLFRTGL